jgi:hypothetical protein
VVEHRVRTDADGVARIRIDDRGQWYVKFIHMEKYKGVRAPSSPDYESKWATLTFEIK